jgi:predicted nuclease of predicted toxin-antitoxin system
VKFLLDMGLAQSTAQFLRRQGYDAIHLRDQGLQRLPDHAIVAKALAEQRVILTHDLDFGRIVAISGQGLPSVVTFRLVNMRAAEVNPYLMDVLTRFSAELTNGALVSVSEQAVRIRKLPIP